MFQSVILGVLLIPVLSLGQIRQSFNSGGANATTTDLRVSSSFGEVFVNYYEARNTKIQEGIFSNNSLTITSLDHEFIEPTVKVYPTLFKSEFTIESINKGRFVIFSGSGQVIMEGRLSELKTGVQLQSPMEWLILKIYLEKNNESFVFKINHSE